MTLTTATVLKLPDFDRQFVVTTDASGAVVGAILEQDFGNGLQPVVFASRKLNDAEMRYSAYERELLGIVWALAQWKHYCRGPHTVIIQTDHAPLRHLPNQASVSESDRVQSSSIRPESESKTSRLVQFKTSVPVSSSSPSSSQCTLAVGRSSIQIENSLREKIYSLLKQEILYKDIIEEIESTRMNELVRGQEKYRKQKNLLMIHVTG